MIECNTFRLRLAPLVSASPLSGFDWRNIFYQSCSFLWGSSRRQSPIIRHCFWCFLDATIACWWYFDVCWTKVDIKMRHKCETDDKEFKEDSQGTCSVDDLFLLFHFRQWLWIFFFSPLHCSFFCSFPHWDCSGRIKTRWRWLVVAMFPFFAVMYSTVQCSLSYWCILFFLVIVIDTNYTLCCKHQCQTVLVVMKAYQNNQVRGLIGNITRLLKTLSTYLQLSDVIIKRTDFQFTNASVRELAYLLRQSSVHLSCSSFFFYLLEKLRARYEIPTQQCVHPAKRLLLSGFVKRIVRNQAISSER